MSRLRGQASYYLDQRGTMNCNLNPCPLCNNPSVKMWFNWDGLMHTISCSCGLNISKSSDTELLQIWNEIHSDNQTELTQEQEIEIMAHIWNTRKGEPKRLCANCKYFKDYLTNEDWGLGNCEIWSNTMNYNDYCDKWVAKE